MFVHVHVRVLRFCFVLFMTIFMFALFVFVLFRFVLFMFMFVHVGVGFVHVVFRFVVRLCFLTKDNFVATSEFSHKLFESHGEER